MSDRLVSAVVDTNLFVSALISARGDPRALYTAWRGGAFILHLADGQRAEIADVLGRRKFLDRFNITAADVQELLYLLDMRARRFPLRASLPLRVRDAKDDHLLAAALGGEADYLVSGDDDLLSLAADARLGTLRIVTVQEFLGLLAHV